MEPLWSADRDLPVFDSVAVADRYDVAVVGAGLTGLVTALMLADAGQQVVVLEARTVGAGTTGASTAKVSVLQGTRLSSIAAKQPAERVQQYVAGNQFGLDWLLQFCARHQVDVQRPAAVTYAADGEQLPRAQQEYEEARRAGLPVAWRDQDEVPFDFAGGVVLAEQAQLDPVELLDALVAAAQQAGATIATGRRVLKVGRESDPEVVLSDGTVKADRVVLATGIPIADRGAFFARVQPQRSYLLAAHQEQAGAMDMYLSAGSPLRSVRTAPAPQGPWVLVGGNSHQTGRSDSEAAEVRDLSAWARANFGAAIGYEWSAQDYHPVDELPYVGALTPRGERVLVATGYDKWGFTNAPAAAAIIAGQIGGELPAWAPAFASWSTHEVSGAGTGAAHNVQAMGTLAADRVSALSTRSQDPAEGAGCVGRQGMRAVATSTTGGITRTLSATCPHMGGLVRWNDAEQSWDCPLHGSRFSAEGDLLEGPATTGLEPVSEDDA